MNPQTLPNNPAPEKPTARLPKSELVLALFASLCAAALYMLVPRIADGGIPFGWGVFAQLGLLVALSIFMLLGKSDPLWYVGSGFLAFAPLLIAPSRIGVIASIVLLLGLISDRTHARNALLKNTNTHVFVPLKTALASSLTGFALVIVSLVFVTTTHEAPNIATLVPQSSVRYTLTHLHQLTGESPIAPDMTVQEYILSRAENNGIPISQFSAAERNRIVLTSIAEFESRFQIALRPDERIADAIHRSTVKFLDRYSSPYARFFPYISAVALFFAIRFVFIPIRFIAISIAMLVMRALTRTGIIKQGARQITIYYPELA